MPSIGTTVSVTVAEEASVAELETAIREELREAGRKLLAGAVRQQEEKALADGGGRWLRDRRRKRQLLTVFG